MKGWKSLFLLLFCKLILGGMMLFMILIVSGALDSVALEMSVFLQQSKQLG